ncbi:hypothetical protein BO70DRAFT_29875 [Aspergillus heteromorphus CBS 117.55]|uniref:Uncharacterized protein n=1 Tax=Aspergillus heteromorphus CBS 117.55 TaxID=1448321 RepID=A0A317W879_9EURO|nr:uncharacterized protein BO70DRAFT_29875 [Aspergillus heteromorphus CBS 117.55]PWY82826.1 hypothetical protein BO70DRAFT_29875 [Aspergillus heteromorphus CBS 117.55]
MEILFFLLCCAAKVALPPSLPMIPIRLMFSLFLSFHFLFSLHYGNEAAMGYDAWLWLRMSMRMKMSMSMSMRQCYTSQVSLILLATCYSPLATSMSMLLCASPTVFCWDARWDHARCGCGHGGLSVFMFTL